MTSLLPRRLFQDHWFGLLALAIAVLFAFLYFSKNPPAEGPEIEVVRICADRLLERLPKQDLTVDLYNQVNTACYNQQISEGTLADWKIRKQKFTLQSYDEKIMLWMVVIITFSGIGLAALQLVASYNLAKAAGTVTPEQSQELTVEQGRIVIKSSVAGIMILAISFGFFALFVYEIYTIKEIGGDPKSVPTSKISSLEESVRSSIIGPLLTDGGVGSPPPQGTEAAPVPAPRDDSNGSRP